MTQEAQDRGKKEGKSTEAWSETGARQHKAGGKIAEETHTQNPTQEAQDKSAKAHLERNKKPTWSGHKVADLTKDTRSTGEMRGRSTEMHTNTVTGK